MKHHFSVVIPTKKYIKAYLQSRFGKEPLIEKGNSVGNKLYDLLEHSGNERKTEFSSDAYTATIKVYISHRTFAFRGCNLNETNIIAFNRFLELEIKERFYFMMDVYIGILPSFEANLPTARKMLGIGEDEWETDSMKKAYYRYRKETGKPQLYKKLVRQYNVSKNESAENTIF